jgi:hypothetical protein
MDAVDQPPQDPSQPVQPVQPAPPPPGPAWGQPSAPPAPQYAPPAQQYAPPPAPSGWAQPAPAPASQWVQPAGVQGPVTGLAKLGGLIIALIAALWIFFGVIIVVGGALTKNLFDSVGSGTDVSNAVGGAIAVFGVIILVFAVIEFLGGLGALFGKDWGRVISVIFGLLFGVACLLIGVSALAGGRSTDSNVATSAIGGAVFFLAHAVLYLFATIVLMARWRRRVTA